MKIAEMNVGTIEIVIEMIKQGKGFKESLVELDSELKDNKFKHLYKTQGDTQEAI